MSFRDTYETDGRMLRRNTEHFTSALREFSTNVMFGINRYRRHSSAPTGLAVVEVKPTQAKARLRKAYVAARSFGYTRRQTRARQSAATAAWAKFPRPFGPQRTQDGRSAHVGLKKPDYERPTSRPADSAIPDARLGRAKAQRRRPSQMSKLQARPERAQDRARCHYPPKEAKRANLLTKRVKRDALLTK